MRQLVLLISGVICLCLASIRCSVDVAGGTIETTNGYVVGAIVDENNLPASNTEVLLLPSSYNPLGNYTVSDSFIDTTDNKGRYSFTVTRRGDYTVQATHLSQNTGTLIRGIHVDFEEEYLYAPDGILKSPGAARIELPDTVDTVTSYIYIPGTKRYQKLSEEILFYVNNMIQVIFDSIPAVELPGIFFGKGDTSFNTIPLTAPFTALSGDTVNLTIQATWHTYTTANSGLPNDDVAAVMTDNTGKLWVGTDMDGLAIRDDTNWTVYTKQNSQLPGNSVQSLACEPNGAVWIGTTSGIVHIQNSIWYVYTTLNSGLHSNFISSIAFEETGMKWFGTTNGCAVFDGNDWTQYSMVDGYLIGTVNAVAVDEEGVVLVGTGDGLYTFDNQVWKKVEISKTDYMYNDIQGIAVDNSNTAWLATAKGLAGFKDGKASIHDTLGLTFFSSNLQCIAVDWNNIFWAGSFYEGTIVKGSNPVVLYNEKNTPALQNVSRINDIDTRTTNSIYFGTENNGIIAITFSYVCK